MIIVSGEIKINIKTNNIFIKKNERIIYIKIY